MPKCRRRVDGHTNDFDIVLLFHWYSFDGGDAIGQRGESGCGNPRPHPRCCCCCWKLVEKNPENFPNENSQICLRFLGTKFTFQIPSTQHLNPVIFIIISFNVGLRHSVMTSNGENYWNNSHISAAEIVKTFSDPFSIKFIFQMAFFLAHFLASNDRTGSKLDGLGATIQPLPRAEPVAEPHCEFHAWKLREASRSFEKTNHHSISFRISPIISVFFFLIISLRSSFILHLFFIYSSFILHLFFIYSR